MGKVTCEACRKKCKGQAIKLPEDKFFHLKCFKCKECSKQLSSGEFYSRDGAHYCPDDYQKLYSVRCKSCGSSIRGEVITVLQCSYHPGCFSCSRCRNKFSAGDKVTYTGTDFLCHSCVTLGLSATTADSPEVRQTVTQEQLTSAPAPTTTGVPRPGQIAVSPASGQPIQSPDSDFSTSNGCSPLSPVSMTSGYKSDISYDQTPDRPRSNGVLSSSTSNTNADSRGFLSPSVPFMQYRSTSPISNASSRKSKDSTGSGTLGRETPNYGKFYKITYLDIKDGFKRGPSINAAAGDTLPQHYHRPEGFSYKKIRTDILRPSKKGVKSSFFTTKPHIRTEPYKPIKTQEPIQLAKLPDAQLPNKTQVSPIERDDWPAPPAPAAAYPELLREGRLRRRSGASSSADMLDSVSIDDKENIETPPVVDPKIEKEIEELSKLPESGAAKVILRDLKKKKYEQPVLDPRSASRTPNAATEPPYRTRYESPIYASPSRDLDLRLQLPPLDDSFAELKYRSPSPANFLSPRPGYGLRSYTLESRNGGYISDHSVDSYYARRPGSSAAVLERSSCYSSQSDLEEFDPTTGLRRNSRLRSTITSDGRSTPYVVSHRRKSVPSVFRVEEPIKIYPYEQLQVRKQDLPIGVDRDHLELHLSKEKFEELFHMTQEEFYHLAEWRQNDLKKRVNLFC